MGQPARQPLGEGRPLLLQALLPQGSLADLPVRPPQPFTPPPPAVKILKVLCGQEIQIKNKNAAWKSLPIDVIRLTSQ